jgi:hypothetical protein
MTAGIQAHQSNLIKQMNAYGSVADYNLNQLIRKCRDAINSAQTQQEAVSIAAHLESALAEKGQTLNDVNGLNMGKINGTATGLAGNIATLDGLQGDAKKAAKKARKEQYKPMFDNLKNEFGVAGNKDKDWIEAAKNNENIKIIDKNGQDVSKTFTGDKLKGTTLEINSKQYGKINIQAGGDGVMNGGDDKITMAGGPAAAGNMLGGLNQINNNFPGQANNPGGLQNPAGLLQAAGIDPMNANPTNAAALDPNMANNGFLSEGQIKSLIAAILNQALFNNQQQNQQVA